MPGRIKGSTTLMNAVNLLQPNVQAPLLIPSGSRKQRKGNQYREGHRKRCVNQSKAKDRIIQSRANEQNRQWQCQER